MALGVHLIQVEVDYLDAETNGKQYDLKKIFVVVQT